MRRSPWAALCTPLLVLGACATPNSYSTLNPQTPEFAAKARVYPGVTREQVSQAVVQIASVEEHWTLPTVRGDTYGRIPLSYAGPSTSGYSYFIWLIPQETREGIRLDITIPTRYGGPEWYLGIADEVYAVLDRYLKVTGRPAASAAPR